MINTVKISKVLGDPIRYKILLMIVNHAEQGVAGYSNPAGGICNCQLMDTFDMIQSRVSYHMKELVEADLVREVPEGKWKYYFPNTEVIKAYIRQLESDFKL
ncbi:HTH ArsR-type DNA-binding domain [Syntrophomonas zehnderi OL-4]|uniref:HTH ArsR-type DNA-binding domain n=2 Tax=Syntrophomonas TaxID=862 RepID=A0A0E4GB92_9FIRM|nr:metalloregulator ArsR/SmtB family transcription factor [Syntrophomonas zehnderi]CFX84157.1 HTH ArsR-type DNA-binding domain [Syntrophomonas zehnderi OL-4]